MKVKAIQNCKTYECILYNGLNSQYKLIPSANEIFEKILSITLNFLMSRDKERLDNNQQEKGLDNNQQEKIAKISEIGFF